MDIKIIKDIKDLLSEFGINAVGALWGVSGAFVAVIINDKHQSFWKALGVIVAGFLIGAGGTNLLGHWFGIESTFVHGGLGFILGINGVRIINAIVKLGKKFEENPAGFINKKGGDDVSDS